MTFRGLVVRKPFGTGSKSQRNAVKLVTDRGEFVLRRQGANPMADPVLAGLVGKSIRCEAILHGYTLIMTSWEETRGS